MCLLRQPSLSISGFDKPISLRSLGRVFIFLVMLRGSSVDREEMASVLWPGELPEVSANRLRVSLNRVRTLVGDRLVTDRERVRLVETIDSVDLWDAELRLRDALDEVDHRHQLALLTGMTLELQSRTWREFLDLDRGQSMTDWDLLCRKALLRMGDLATTLHDWEGVDQAFRSSVIRGDFDRVLAEQFLAAHDERDQLDAGFKEVRQSATSLEVSLESVEFVSLRNYWQKLRDSAHRGKQFRTAHYHLMGRSLLDRIEGHAGLLADLVTTQDVQIPMQASPSEFLEILDAIQVFLEVGSPRWIAVEVARLSNFASLYDSQQMLAISQGLLDHELTPVQEGRTRMTYSFCLFQFRRWEEALESIREAQRVTLAHGMSDVYEVTVATESAFLWHLGEFKRAKELYDGFLDRVTGLESSTLGLNWAIVQSNYGVIELIFGDILEARRRVDLSYAHRTHVNIERALPLLFSLMGVVYARSGDVDEGVEFAIEGLKLTTWRGSSRESQINLEWACGILVIGGLRAEAHSVMDWTDRWRKRTGHVRSPAELRFEESLALGDLEGSRRLLDPDLPVADVMRFMIRQLRKVQGRRRAAN